MNKVITLLILAFILTIIWFHKGLVLGGGEAGVPFYYFQNELGIQSNAWVGKALGNPTGIVTALSPIFYLFSQLQYIGVSPVFIQAGLFFIFLSTGFVGMYLLTKKFSSNTTIAFFSSLFYNLNFMAMIIVWNRFQYPFMFLYACLPLALYLFIRGLTERKIIFACLLNLLTLAFVMFVTSIPLLLLFWTILGLYTLFFVGINLKNKKKIMWALGYFGICLALFLVFNSWWIIQFVLTFFASSYLFDQAYATSDNYITFSALSNSLGNLNFLIRLMHKDFFLWMKDVWGAIYFNPFFVLLSFLPVAFVFGSAFIKSKPKEYYFYLFLALAAVFFAKGSNDPFGGISYFLFTHNKFFEAFRNPFEKIGLIIPLAYAPLFGFGLYHFYLYLKNKKNLFARPITGLVLFLICGLLVWPMWNGWVFTSNEPPTDNTKIGDYIKIPDYYKDANNWLNQNPEEFRVIALPLKGEGFTHDWEYGYNGVDLSSSLFDKPFLAFCTGLEYLCPITNKLQPELTRHPKDFWKVLPPLNASYVMIRDDVNANLRSLQEPKDIESLIQQDPEHFILDKKIGKLSFYKLKDDLKQPKIDGANSAIYYNNPANESFIESSTYADYQKGDIYIVDINKKLDPHENFAKQILLKADLFTGSGLALSDENAQAALPYIRFLPGSPFYWYTRVKEKFTRFMAGNNAYREITIESGKRIVETKKLLEKNQFILAEKTLQEYQSYLKLFLKNRSIMSDNVNQMDLIRQKYILSDVIELAKKNKQPLDSYEETQSLLSDVLYMLGIQTKYPVDLSKYASYKTNIPEEGSYELLFETKDWNKYYLNQEIEMIVDNKEKIILAIDPASETIQTNIFLTTGEHQIDILRPEAINLIENRQDTQVFETDQKTASYTFPFSQFDPFGIYAVTFDYYVTKGNIPNIFVSHDTDAIKKGKVIPFTDFKLDVDFYNRDWISYAATVDSDLIAHMSSLVFKISPWNDCELRNTGLLRVRCEDTRFKNNYNKKTVVQTKNISITRKINNNLFLRKERTVKDSLSKPTIYFTKVNPSTYIVDVKHATTPFFLSFLETFHPSWKAYYIDGSKKKIAIDEKNHFLINSFANGWFVEKTGDYTILLEFKPENYLVIGKAISLITIMGVIFWIISRRLRRKHGKK